MIDRLEDLTKDVRGSSAGFLIPALNGRAQGLL